MLKYFYCFIFTVKITYSNKIYKNKGKIKSILYSYHSIVSIVKLRKMNSCFIKQSNFHFSLSIISNKCLKNIRCKKENK